MFADCLHSTTSTSHQNLDDDALDLPHLQQLVDDMAGDMDVALKNLVGDGAADLAERWAENGKLKQKLEVVRASLGPVENQLLDRLLGVQSSPSELGNTSLSRDVKGKGKEEPVMRFIDSEDESDDDGFSEDERGKTAHRLFASLAGIEENEHAWWVPSQASQTSDTTRVLDELEMEKSRSTKNPPVVPGDTGVEVPWAAKQLTPVSSPVRLVQGKPSPRMVLTSGKRKHHSISMSPSCTLPHLQTRLVAGGRSPIPFMNSRTPTPHPHIVTHPSNQCITAPLPLSSQLPIPTPQQRDSSPSPLLEVNNYPPKRSILQAPTSSDGAPEAVKRKDSNPEYPVIHSLGSDENRASTEALSLTRPFFRESRRKPSIHQRPPPTSPNGLLLLSRVRVREEEEEDPRARDRRARRSKLHAQRLSIAERIARARPDLVVQSYASKREALLVREVKARGRARARAREWWEKEKMKAHFEGIGTLLSIGTVDDDDEGEGEGEGEGDGGMDWDRSRLLAEVIKADIAKGRRPILPPLTCVESQ